MEYLQALWTTQKLYQRCAYRRWQILDEEAAYEGRHRLVFASDEWAEFTARRFSNFSDNWCAVVADAPQDRTAVTGFELPGSDDSFTAEERALWSDWLSNDMDAQQSQGFLTTRTARRSFVLVWGDREGNPIITWDHPLFCEVDYDDENPRIRTSALRTWRDEKNEYGTLYTPTEVWKFYRPLSRDEITGRPKSQIDKMNFGMAAGWIQRDIPGEIWPAPNPMGVVPIVEVRNRPMLRGEPISDIAGVMAMQHAINLLWAYLFNSADYASLPGRVVTGAEPPKMPILDSTGNVIGEKPLEMKEIAKKRMLWLSGGGDIEQWDAAKLDVFTDVIDVAVRHIGAQTRTPAHYLGVANMSNVNADALKMDEVGLAQKVRETHLYASQPMREVFRLIALVRGNLAVATAARAGRVAWRNPEIRSDAQLADAFQKDIAAGFPFEWLARNRYGLSPEQVAQVMEFKRKEQVATGIAMRAALAGVTDDGGQ